MGHHDQYERRIKWTRAKEKMVHEMKEVGLQPCKPILSYRSKPEKLGKQPMYNPSTKDPELPPHL